MYSQSMICMIQKLPQIAVNKLFQPQETELEQDKCLGYLKQFVKGLDGPTLKTFL
jgi:hypothetical protein